MIVTVALNPSLDRTLSVAEIIPGTLHRARLMRVDLGGKGINVARTLKNLDLPSRIVGVAGGRTGRALIDGLQAEEFEVSFIEANDEIRENITLFDESNNQYTKINEQGPTSGPELIAALEKLIEGMLRPGDLWALCGSLPPGAPNDLYATLINQIHDHKAFAFLDTSGAALGEGIRSRPFALKVNTEEAGEFLGRCLESEHEAAEAAREIQAMGISLVMLTRGAQGLVLGMQTGMVSAVPPSVNALSPVGAGDATLAGLLWAVSDQCDAVTTASRATACGTAAVLQDGTGTGGRAIIQDLMGRINVNRL